MLLFQVLSKYLSLRWCAMANGRYHHVDAFQYHGRYLFPVRTNFRRRYDQIIQSETRIGFCTLTYFEELDPNEGMNIICCSYSALSVDLLVEPPLYHVNWH